MNSYSFFLKPFAFICDTSETLLLKYLQLVSICSPLSLLAVGPKSGEGHLLFHRVFCFAERANNAEAECKWLFHSCDWCHNRPIQPNEQMCVKWPRFCSCVCSYSMCDVYAAKGKEKAAGQTQGLLWKQWPFRHHLTQLLWLPCKCLASPWCLKWVLESFSSFQILQRTCPLETSSSWLRGRMSTRFCSQLHMFNCKKAIARVKRKM